MELQIIHRDRKLVQPAYYVAVAGAALHNIAVLLAEVMTNRNVEQVLLVFVLFLYQEYNNIGFYIYRFTYVITIAIVFMKGLCFK